MRRAYHAGMLSTPTAAAWPALPYDEWKDTYATLHMWLQVVGKIALAQSPPVNHSWGVAMHVTARGLSTHLLPHGIRTFTVKFDFVRHELVVQICDGEQRTLPLKNQSVADFYRDVMNLLREMDLPVRIWTMPAEVPNPIRF